MPAIAFLYSLSLFIYDVYDDQAFVGCPNAKSIAPSEPDGNCGVIVDTQNYLSSEHPGAEHVAYFCRET